ncbi:hypothetical protein EG327_001998 [Venturia inaequalis]|uniref:Aminoglycoside phosphotransferase domain-containing protein n=1 Tax=Venturia inaequalis TaxID=5025 RepID=A0A8H3VKD8_VENIN|nr:hypothetical protein EG327_001998 [Venturia inaequalis]
MFCPMSPPIEASVRKISPDVWMLGSKMICERIRAVGGNCVASWSDESGNLFQLRQQQTSAQDLVDAEIDAHRRIHFAGTSAAAWKIGDAYCKVKSYVPGMEYEADSISFFRSKVPAIPLPEVIHSWVDEELCRTFLILGQVKGKTLAESWHLLSSKQRTTIARTVASFCTLLAQNSESSLQSVAGRSIYEPHLTKSPYQSRPSWMLCPLGPFKPHELAQYLGESQLATLPVIPDTFYFYHADLGPTNIIISKEGHIEGVLDWESAGFFPKFWIATKPLISAGFNLPQESDADRYAWANMFSAALEVEGFEVAMDQFKMWKICCDKQM